MSLSNEEEKIPYLHFLSKDNTPCQMEITGPVFSIGRSNDNDLQIKDTLISRKHADIIRTAGGEFVLYDRDSKSGTFINGKRVVEHVLKAGDEIILGDPSITRLRFDYPSSAPPTELPFVETKAPFEMRITDRQTRYLNLDLMRQAEPVSSRTLQRLTSLYEITHKLLPVQSVNELIEIWLDALFLNLPVERGAVLLFDPVTRQLEMTMSRDKNNNHNVPINLSKTIVEQTFHENVAILSHDAMSDERFATRQSIIIQNIRSVLSAPTSSQRRVWGVCYLYCHQAAQFDAEDLEFLMATAREAGLVLENLRLIEELRATQEQLIKSERMAAVGKLTSSISHELRNRLALLSGAEVIAMKYRDDPEVVRFTEMVLTGQRRSLALVEEIRAFARNRPVEFEKSRRPIVETIEKTISLLRYDTNINRRKLTFAYEASPKLFFNEEKIEQVIINLVRNATEATAESNGRIDIFLRIDGAEAVITVTDNGTGIAPEVQDQIWEPFFSTKGEDGTGLGLEICRRLIEAHSGTISCHSEVDRGTTFSIRLPLPDINMEDMETGPLPEAGNQEPKAPGSIKPVVTPARLSSLPTAVLTTLKHAVIIGDVEEANAAIDEIAQTDQSLSQELRLMVRSYRFDELQEVLEQCV